eukprot:tig00021038_g17509.t1
MAWSVHTASSDASSSSATLDAVLPLYNASLHLDDGFIAQNAVPRYASAGYGGLEGVYADGPRFGFYVIGDTLIRFSRPPEASSREDMTALGGPLAGTLQLTEEEGWAPSRRRWYSVGAVAYQDGSLFIAREAMSAPFGDGMASDKIDVDITGKKIDFSRLYANSSELLKVFNADGEQMGPVVVVKGFVPGVR